MNEEACQVRSGKASSRFNQQRCRAPVCPSARKVEEYVCNAQEAEAVAAEEVEGWS